MSVSLKTRGQVNVMLLKHKRDECLF